MKNKIQNTAKLLSLIIMPWIWFCARFCPSLLRATLLASRAFLNPQFSSYLLEEPLLKIGARGMNSIHPRSLTCSDHVPLQISLDLNDTIQRSFYLRGFPDFTSELLRFCDSSTCFFDIGANVGLISCAVSRYVAPKQIYAFEPVPANFEALRRNLTTNCPGATPHAIALSDKEGAFEMVACSHDSGAASLETQYRIDRLTELGYPTTLVRVGVLTISFSQYIVKQSIDFSRLKKVAFKIDVEGHELAVLNGMKLFLDAYNYLEILIVIEVHNLNFESVNQFLSDNAFGLVWPNAEAISAFHQSSSKAIDLIFRRHPKIDIAS